MVSETSAFSALSSGVFGRDVDGFADGADGEARVDRGDGVHFDVHVLRCVGREARRFDAHLVDADDQVALGVVAGFVGEGVVGDAFSRVGDDDLGIRDGGSAGIGDVSGNASVNRLPEESFGCGQGQRTQTKRKSSHVYPLSAGRLDRLLARVYQEAGANTMKSVCQRQAAVHSSESVCRTAAVFTLDQLLSGVDADVQFVNVAREAGLRAKTIYGSEKRNRYLMETTGCGAAFFDYDQDGWLDIFLVNGSRFEGGWTRGERAGQPAVQEQSRRHVYGCDLGGGDRANRLGVGMLRRRFR